MRAWKFANSDGKSFHDRTTDYRAYIGKPMVHPGTHGYYLGKTLNVTRGYAPAEAVFECFYLKSDVIRDSGDVVVVKRLWVVKECPLLKGRHARTTRKSV